VAIRAVTTRDAFQVGCARFVGVAFLVVSLRLSVSRNLRETVSGTRQSSGAFTSGAAGSSSLCDGHLLSPGPVAGADSLRFPHNTRAPELATGISP